MSEKLRHAVANAQFHYRNVAVPITISAGYGGFHASDTPEDVLQRADKALYRVKAEGRNRCRGGDA